MRADTGGQALVLPCPQCATRWSTEQTCAAHLMDAHGTEAPESRRGPTMRGLIYSFDIRLG